MVNNIQDELEAVRARAELYQRFKKETNVVQKFNLFVEMFCQEDYSHLIDSDENAGEYMRDAIRQLYKKGFGDGQDSMLYNGQIQLVTIEEAQKLVRQEVAQELESYRDDILAGRNIRNPTWIGKHELNKFIEGLRGN